MVVALTDQDCAKDIGAVAGTIAFTSLAQMMTWERQYVVLELDGIAPNVATLSSGAYPLFRPFYLVQKREASGAADMFAKFITSPDGKKILLETGNMPVTKVLADQ